MHVNGRFDRESIIDYRNRKWNGKEKNDSQINRVIFSVVDCCSFSHSHSALTVMGVHLIVLLTVKSCSVLVLAVSVGLPILAWISHYAFQSLGIRRK
jgi:hypothetical protein